MHRKAPGSYTLTASIVAAHAGGAVVCLDASAHGRAYRLHAARPESYEHVRADVVGWTGLAEDVAPLDPVVTIGRVGVYGPIEQRAGYHDPCGGWTDGNDAIADRLCAALRDPECGAVLSLWDTPGGSPLGLTEGARRVLEAKAETGKKIIGFIDDGMCASAGYWWACLVCDVLFLPPQGMAGSIGARSSHGDMSNALLKEGIAVTHFCWPGAGKIAFAPELPLSELGKSRAERDITMIGEAFGASVAGARGLTIDAIRAMDADIYMGAEAVAMGLCDGVATLEETTAYALTLASGAGEDMATEEEKMPPGAEGDDGEEEAAGEGDEPSTACASCNMAQEPNAKFCDQCGASMAAPKAAEEPADDEGDSKPAAPPGKPGAVAYAPRMAPGATASLASLAGLHAGASQPAILSALAKRVGVYTAAAKLTGRASAGEIVGGLNAMAADAAAAGELRGQLKTAQSKANAQERMDLLGKLAAARVHTRGELFEDIVTDGGKRVGVKPAKLWSAAPEGRSLANLRGYVASKLENAGPVQQSPWQPDADAARAAVNGADIERRAGGKVVQRAATRSTASVETLAASEAALAAAGAFGA